MAASASSTQRNNKRHTGALIAICALALCVLGSSAPSALAAPPTISAEAATDVALTFAKGHAKVSPEGEETYYRFDAVSDAQYDENITNGIGGFDSGRIESSGGAVEAGAAPETPVEGEFTNLAAGTEYHLRFVAVHLSDEVFVYAEAPNFTTEAATAPSLAIDPATGVAFTKAHISGTVDPEGGNQQSGAPLSIGWELQISTTAGEGFFGVASGGFEGTDAESTSALPVEANLEGLANGTTYHYRLVAYYAGRQEISSEDSFTTDLVTKPLVEVDPASQVTGQTAHFSGEVTAGNSDPAFDSSCFFDFVPDDAFNRPVEGGWVAPEVRTIPCGPSPVKGTSAVAVSADPTGLIPSTTYHLRLRAENLGGQEIEEAPTFLTEAIAPKTSNLSSSDLTATTATLRASVNPGGAETSYRFEYLTLAAYEANGGSFSGASQTPSASAGEDAQFHPVEADLTGLQSGTAYRFRVVATNSQGTSASSPAAFQTTGAAESCPNKAVREQQGSTFLPECRAYEIVNTPGLDLGEANRVPWSSDDGNHVVYGSVIPGDQANGAGVSSFTIAHRTPQGWIRESIDPLSQGGISGITGVTDFRAVSSDFSRALVSTTLPALQGDGDSQPDYYNIEAGSGAPALMSPSLDTFSLGALGASSNLERLVFIKADGTEPVPGIYLSDGTDLELLSVYPDNKTPLEPGRPQAAGGQYSRGIAGTTETIGTNIGPFVERGGTHAVSDNAERVYFYDQGAENFLYVRDLTTDPKRTIPVSISSRTGDTGSIYGSRFISASHDGSQAYFASEAQLTDAATPGGGIYRFDLDAPEGQRLTLITPDAGDPTGLHLGGAVASDDQSHLYFTSTSALAAGAQPGVVNAYVWTQASGPRFIAAVASSADRFYRVSPDGRFALMLAQASIDGSSNNGHLALYRYDFSADEIACVSCRPDGSPSQGDAGIEAQSYGQAAGPLTRSRGMTFDGRVVFTSTDRITAADQTSAQDVYIYNDGKVSLLSSGTEPTPSYIGDNSDDGRSVTIVTRAALVGADRDADEYDVYAVRTDGGFLEPPPPPAPCQGEACRGPDSSAPAPSSPITPGVVNPGNPKACPKGKVRRNNRCVKPHKKKHAKGKQNKKHKSSKRHADTNRRAGR